MTHRRHRVFLLSPARCGGERAQRLMRADASGDLAQRLRSDGGAPLGEVFTYLSSLYFRGKMAYTNRFADPPAGLAGGLVITANRGLLPVDLTVTVADLRGFATVDIDADDPRYRGPLERDLAQLRVLAGAATDVVLLGSVATAKYVEVIAGVLGERLLFPSSFVGRGDMSRGGLMLRSARAGEELEYVPVLGATRHGARPPRLGPR
jgi:hypothetical protein